MIDFYQLMFFSECDSKFELTKIKRLHRIVIYRFHKRGGVVLQGSGISVELSLLGQIGAWNEVGRRMRSDRYDDRPEMAIVHAMGAYDNLGKHLVMANRGRFTKSQVDVMMGLDLFGKMGMTQISEHLAVSKEQASRAVAPLVEQGLVRRERSAEQHRMIRVSLTEEGRRSVAAAHQALLSRLLERLAELSPSEREQLIDASRKALSVLFKLQKSETA